MSIIHPFEGIYDVPSAARYVLAGRMAEEIYPVTSRHLIRWIRNGFALPDLAEVSGREMLIGFEDLISLRVITALRAYKVTWPDIYRAERWLREHTKHSRPFATEEIWTMGSGVFVDFSKLIISASRHGQLAMDIIRDYLIPISGLTFESGIADTWESWRLVVLDPEVQFGAPCIRGTRIPTRALGSMLKGGDDPDLVKRAYSISQEELDAAISWEERIAA